MKGKLYTKCLAGGVISRNPKCDGSFQNKWKKDTAHSMEDVLFCRVF